MAPTSKNDFNLAAKIFLGLAVMALITETVLAGIEYYNYTFFISDKKMIPDHLMKEMAINLAIVICSFFVYKREKYGLIVFMILAVVRIFAIVPSSSISKAYYQGQNTMLFIRDFAPFFIALCFRKKGTGVSGWHVFFPAEEPTEDAKSKEIVPPMSDPIINAVHEQPTKNSNVVPTDIGLGKPSTVNNEQCLEDDEDCVRIDVRGPEPSYYDLLRKVEALETENAKLKQMYAEMALKYSETRVKF